ncbi:MAG: NAD-dependent malic enzyme [Firmicutes bacterium]|nr:NAD-dependent malic enzyme [Bacillota bacterium]
MSIQEESLRLHEKWRGKIEVVSRVEVNDRKDLSLAYTPGVAEPCLAIKNDPGLSYLYTRRWNLVAVVTDGSAILGLGDIGAEAGMPVMEGKCVLFKSFAGVDAFPLCINSRDVDVIVETVSLISSSFGGINLEDISAPRCFEIERKLKGKCDIPVFHDDQHGTAVVTLAAMINALKIVGKRIEDISVVVNGSGSAGIAITRLLLKYGLQDIVLCDTGGAIFAGRPDLNFEKAAMARITNPLNKRGMLRDVIRGADVFIGVSAPGVVDRDMLRSMAREPIVFAMANPIPEIMPEEAKETGVKVMGTGRSDYPNQINNVLAFPGIFRGALDVRAADINDEMKIAASRAIAFLVDGNELDAKYILPEPFDDRVGSRVAAAVAGAARESGVARL